MKKLDWYFNFIGVKSEGWKRIIVLLILIWCLFLFVVSMEPKGELSEIIGFGFIWLIIISLILKILNWIKEGFRKE